MIVAYVDLLNPALSRKYTSAITAAAGETHPPAHGVLRVVTADDLRSISKDTLLELCTELDPRSVRPGHWRLPERAIRDYAFATIMRCVKKVGGNRHDLRDRLRDHFYRNSESSYTMTELRVHLGDDPQKILAAIRALKHPKLCGEGGQMHIFLNKETGTYSALNNYNDERKHG